MRVVITTYSYYVLGDRPIWRGIGYDEYGNPFSMDVFHESIRPRMYVVESDFPIFMETVKAYGLDKLIIKIVDWPITSVYDERCKAVFVRLPEHVRKIRDVLPQDVKTLASDIPWEKNVIYILGWSSPYFYIQDSAIDHLIEFVPLGAIKNGQEYEFPFQRRIAYWDIETDNSIGGLVQNSFEIADKIPIISYVLLDPVDKLITYYAAYEDFEDSKEERIWKTSIPAETLSLPSFEKYPRSWRLIIKKFKRERDMHLEFINDFAEKRYNELVTFNGRGGNSHIRGRREWSNGYDMPLFYRRCLELGLGSEIQRLSPFPLISKDRPNVYERVEKLADGSIKKYEVFIRGVAQHDLYYDDKVLMYSRGEQMRRHNLDTFLENFIGMNKVDHSGLSVWELFYTDQEKEMEYNIVDVEGLYALDVKLGYTKDIWMRASLFNIKIEDVVYTAKLHDHITLLLTRDMFLLDTRGNYRPTRYRGMLEYANTKVGGFNLEAKSGIYGYKEVQYGIVLDFKSLYPSIISSLNAGPSTKIELSHLSFDKHGLWLVDYFGKRYSWNKVARSVNGGFFRKDRESIERFIYKYLNGKRDGMKKIAHDYERQYEETGDNRFKVLAVVYANKEYAIKPMINGRFGSTGYEGSRTFDIVIYNTPTATGQDLIKEVIDTVESWGYTVVLASTDSAFVILKSKEVREAFEEAKQLRDKVNEHISEYAEREYNVYSNDIRIDIEKLFDNAIIVNKRYYSLNVVVKEDRGDIFIYDEPKLYVKGMEYVRRDSALITDDIQRRVIDMIRTRKTVEEIREYLRDINSRFDTFPWAYICQRAGISGPVNSGKGAKYEACRNANKYLGKTYDAGSNPLFAKFIRHPSKFNGRELPSGPLNIAFDEEDEQMLKKYGFVPDYGHLKETVFYSKMDKFTKLLTGESCVNFIRKKISLGDFI